MGTIMHCNLDMCSLCVIKHCGLKRHNHKLLGIVLYYNHSYDS